MILRTTNRFEKDLKRAKRRGKDDALELDPIAMYLDLTGKSFEDLHPRPWPDLVS